MATTVSPISKIAPSSAGDATAEVLGRGLGDLLARGALSGLFAERL